MYVYGEGGESVLFLVFLLFLVNWLQLSFYDNKISIASGITTISREGWGMNCVEAKGEEKHVTEEILHNK